MAVKTRSKSSVRKSTPRAAKVPSKAKFDRVPYTKTELVKWKGFLSWLIVNTFTLGTIFTGFIILVVPTPLPKFMTSTLGVSDRWTPIVLASVAVFCDIADGKLARAWKVQSKVGATFDGLADMMAFGIGPPYVFRHKVCGGERPRCPAAVGYHDLRGSRRLPYFQVPCPNVLVLQRVVQRHADKRCRVYISHVRRRSWV